ncbi:MAG TPA: S1/P1 nuclease [Gemmatimonadales bacterium]|nr:S1/P1 nuclease [Gemmatimonadales bacterium]
MVLGTVLTPVPPAPPLPPAWGYDAHRLICEITWRELTPRAKERVLELLRGDPFSERFSESCIWADEMRRDSAYARYRTAHYMNVPPGAAGVDPAVHCAGSYCVIEASRDLVPAVADAARPRERRREALKLLAHFVSDLHQPLHVGRPADQGGNGTAVVFLGEPSNLHVVWDASLLQQYLLDPWDATRLQQMITPVDRARWKDLDPVTWANESYEIVERLAYRGVESGTLDASYGERLRYVMEERVLQAGYRLGLILNQAFDPHP